MFQKVKETAVTLQVGIQHVYSLLWMGEIEAIKVGRHWRLASESVIEYVKRHPKRKIAESTDNFIYQGNGGYLFSYKADYPTVNIQQKTACMERRGRQLVHRAGRPDKVLLSKLQSLTQLELFTA